MNAQIITSEDELLRLQPDWERLVQSSPETDMPFYSFEWFYRSWLHFEKPLGRKLFIVTINDGGVPAGILPLIQKMRTSAKMTYRCLGFCSVGMMPRNTVYTAPQKNQTEIFQSVWECLFANRSAWDMLEFDNVPEAAPFHRFILDEPHNTKYALIQNQGFIAPYIELTGTMDDYLAGLSKGTRKDLRKHVKHFEESGASRSVRFYEKPEEIAEGLKHLEAVHSNSWKGAFANPHYPQFYAEITPVLAESGTVKIVIAFLDEVPIGVGYMLTKNGTYYGCIRDYDQRYREYAPGIMLLYYQLEHLLQESGRIFDFCGTTYDHKEKFGTGHLNHSSFQIFHGSLKSRFMYWAKTVLLPLYRKVFRKPMPKDFIMCRPFLSAVKKMYYNIHHND